MAALRLQGFSVTKEMSFYERAYAAEILSFSDPDTVLNEMGERTFIIVADKGIPTYIAGEIAAHLGLKSSIMSLPRTYLVSTSTLEISRHPAVFLSRVLGRIFCDNSTPVRGVISIGVGVSINSNCSLGNTFRQSFSGQEVFARCSSVSSEIAVTFCDLRGSIPRSAAMAVTVDVEDKNYSVCKIVDFANALLAGSDGILTQNTISCVRRLMETTMRF